MDVGGTTSRARITDLGGRTLGRGSAGGGNPNSHRPRQAIRQIITAAREALCGVDPARVRAGVLGMAGSSRMADPAVAHELDHARHEIGLTCPIRVITDCEVAFAAGTAHPTGTVLVAGTGAVAARIEDHRLSATAGGHGWLLGDEGSAFWLGREAVRRALRGIEGREPREELTAQVCARLLDGTHSADDARSHVINAVTAMPPIQLAELAPLVTSAAHAGHPAAVEIVRRAARLLADTARAIRTPDDTTPIVLAGGLVTSDSPVGVAVRAELTAVTGDRPNSAGPGDAGAAWLAARDLVGSNTRTAIELHTDYLTET
jgi:N-acetylglucosamine kinase-like BadF-type ATPase